MTRKIWISSALALAAATLVLAPTTAFAGSPLLSGYGGPGAGEQAILGSTLIGGSRGGGASGSGGSGGASLSGSAGVPSSGGRGTYSTGSGSAPGPKEGAANAGTGSGARAGTSKGGDTSSKGGQTSRASAEQANGGCRQRLGGCLRVFDLAGLHSQCIPLVWHIERRCAPTDRDPRHAWAGGCAHPAAFPATELVPSDR